VGFLSFCIFCARGFCARITYTLATKVGVGRDLANCSKRLPDHGLSRRELQNRWSTFGHFDIARFELKMGNNSAKEN
jgi:hypothetical protein